MEEMTSSTTKCSLQPVMRLRGTSEVRCQKILQSALDKEHGEAKCGGLAANVGQTEEADETEIDMLSGMRIIVISGFILAAEKAIHFSMPRCRPPACGLHGFLLLIES
jgi:hypothetical protein